jgi:hypothetical protein
MWYVLLDGVFGIIKKKEINNMSNCFYSSSGKLKGNTFRKIKEELNKNDIPEMCRTSTRNWVIRTSCKLVSNIGKAIGANLPRDKHSLSLIASSVYAQEAIGELLEQVMMIEDGEKKRG